MECIEPATPDDLEQLADLLALLFAEEADFVPDRPKQLRGLRMILESPHVGQILVARAGERVVGMVSLLFTVSTAEGAPACWLEDLIVRPEHRGAGIGGRLLEQAAATAAARGVARITLLTDRTNAAAIGFYRRHGFSPSAMIPLRRPL